MTIPTAPTHDSLVRRDRTRRQPTGKRLTVRTRDLLWFSMLHRHGPLSSTYLHAFSAATHRSEKRARDRLTDLFHEEETPHGGPYLDRPWQQFNTLNARYQDLIYSLTPASQAALREHGLWSAYAAGPLGPWLHRYMVSCITASIELGTLADPSLTYIPQADILERAGAALRYPVAFTDPKTGKTETKDLIPDALFGLGYKAANRQVFRFFVVEADRATEPTRASHFNRKSHLRNLLQYREYIGNRLYRHHLSLTSNLLVLNVSTSEQTQDRVLHLAEELAGTGISYQLFQTTEAFGCIFRPPKVLRHLLREPWSRAGQDPFYIDRP